MNKITTQVKFTIVLLSLIAFALAFLTIILNQKTKNNAFVVNVAGKERMLTQKMAKEIFVNISRETPDYSEFELAKLEFIKNLEGLIRGDSKRGISAPPSKKIATQLENIKNRSDRFFALAKRVQNGENNKEIVADLYAVNIELLALIDESVTEYTTQFESKRESLERLQYGGIAIILFAVFGTFLLVRKIEQKFNKFLNDTKEIGSVSTTEENALGDGAKEKKDNIGELDLAKVEIRAFMSKVQDVISRAEAALEESERAIAELESNAQIAQAKLQDNKLDQKTREELENYIDKSEDIAIGSLEDIAGTKAMLKRFKSSLTKINEKIS